MNRSKWSHAIIKFLCKGNAFWTRFSVQSASLGTRRLLPGNLGGLSPELRIRENILFTEFLPSVLKKKSLCGRRSSVTLQYLRRELPPSRRLCCVGDLSLRFSASPATSPPPPHHPLCAAAGPRGASGLGEVPLPRARALATCLPSLHSSMGNRRRRRSRAGAGGGSRRGSCGRRRPGVRPPQPGPGLAAPAPSRPRGARPPLAFS